jgi:hypothetical protein
MMRLRCALARLNDHWLGDLIGSVCLFGSGYGLFLLGYGLGL